VQTGARVLLGIGARRSDRLAPAVVEPLDTARRADMDFQSAQSKAIRNVVVAAIPLVVDAAYQAAKGSMLRKVEQNPKGALDHALDTIERLNVPIARVERKMGRPAEKWTPREIVRVIMDAYSVRDGVMSAAEVWPPMPSDEQTPQQHAETVVQEAAAAEAPMAAAAEAAEGRGEAGEEARAGGSSAASDAPERPHDPPPPAAPPPEPAPPKPRRQAPPPAESSPPPSEAPSGLSFE
jgi:hypothetical protein